MSRLQILLTEDFLELEKEEQYETYSAYYRFVYGMVFSMVRDHSETEDVIQEAFLRIVSKPPKNKESLYAKSWTLKITRNVPLNYLRKLNKSRDHLRQPNFENVPGVFVESLTVEQQVEESLLEQVMSDCIGRLKPEYQQVIEMRIVHEFSYKEIAAIMNISEGAVRQRLARGKRVIKNLLIREGLGINQ